jgi:hypothetical protein
MSQHWWSTVNIILCWVPYVPPTRSGLAQTGFSTESDTHVPSERTTTCNESYSRDRRKGEKGDLTPQYNDRSQSVGIELMVIETRAAGPSSQQQYQESTVTVLKKHLHYYMLLRRHTGCIWPWSLSYLIGSNWIPLQLLLVPSTKLAIEQPPIETHSFKVAR